MNNIIILIFVLCCAQMPFAQNIQIKGHFAEAKTDPLNNLFLLDENRQNLYKYSPDGVLLKHFNYNLKGQIEHWSIDNPNSPLLYFPKYQSLILLDKNLNIQEEINLNQWQENFSIENINISQDRQLWIIDQNTQQLKKINLQGKISYQSPEFYFLFNQEMKPITLFEYDAMVFLIHNDNHITIFDNYANYQTTLKIEQTEEIKQPYFQNNYLFFKQKQNFFRFQLRQQKMEQIELHNADNQELRGFFNTPFGYWILSNTQISFYKTQKK